MIAHDANLRVRYRIMYVYTNMDNRDFNKCVNLFHLETGVQGVIEDEMTSRRILIRLGVRKCINY